MLKLLWQDRLSNMFKRHNFMEVFIQTSSLLAVFCVEVRLFLAHKFTSSAENLFLSLC